MLLMGIIFIVMKVFYENISTSSELQYAASINYKNYLIKWLSPEASLQINKGETLNSYKINVIQ